MLFTAAATANVADASSTAGSTAPEFALVDAFARGGPSHFRQLHDFAPRTLKTGNSTGRARGPVRTVRPAVGGGLAARRYEAITKMSSTPYRAAKDYQAEGYEKDDEESRPVRRAGAPMSRTISSDLTSPQHGRCFVFARLGAAARADAPRRGRIESSAWCLTRDRWCRSAADVLETRDRG